MASTNKNKKRSFKSRLRRFFRIAVALCEKIGSLIAEGAKSTWEWLLSLPRKTQLIGIGSVCGALVVILIVVAATSGNRNATPAADPSGDNAVYIYSPSDSASDGVGGDTAITEDMSDEQIEAINAPVEDASDTTGVGNATEAATQTVYLTKGNTDDLVLTVQSSLMELGYMDDDEPTTYYGKLTASAVKTFQRHNGLTDDGVCGQATYDLLTSGSAKAYVMQLGDSGEDVEGAQERLYELGYFSSKSAIDGSFGSSMEEAVKEFQSANKLTSDGKAGNKTLTTLYSDSAVSKLFKIGEKDDVIKTVQTKLIKLGYFTGTATGEFTKQTVASIKDFQSDNDLVVDGNLGPATKAAILSNSAQSKVVKLGDKGSDVTAIQKRLIALKYMKSGADTGYYGATTEAAVKAFQKRNGLTQDGKVGATTLKKLNASNAKKALTVTPTPAPKKTTSGSSKPSATAKPSSSSSSSSTSSTGNTKLDKLINAAKSKLGCPYVRGGKGPNKFDCSGFVYWCLNQAGVRQSYMTSIAWRSCSKYQKITSLSSIQKGDILVFSGSTSATGHVGIAISSGSMIDASSSQGKVRTTQVTSNYWKTHFICAYRVF